MKYLRAWFLPLTCAAVTASSTAHAQARAPVPKAPPIGNRSATAPCRVAEATCLVSARARTVALAWEKGLDEHGVPLDAGARANKSSEMEMWLRRLAGTYRIAGTYRNHGGESPVCGTAKCLGVGGGPGVSCVINAAWKAPKESFKEPELDKSLYDAMRSLVIHYGIDPDSSQIRATVMDFRAVKIQGFLFENAVGFKGEGLPWNRLVHYTWRSSLVTIETSGDVNMKFAVWPTSAPYGVAGLRLLASQSLPNLEIEFDLQLHREPAVEDE